MNGSGCRNCPVVNCETMNYRGSTCAAQRAKLGLGDPNDRTDCWQFQDCYYRNDVGWCPENCVQYRHKDEVRVTRCQNCNWWHRHKKGDLSRGVCDKYAVSKSENGYCDDPLLEERKYPWKN